MNRKMIRQVLVFLCTFCLTCCKPQDTLPSVLRIGVLPDENPVLLKQRYTRLVNYLSEATGVPCELVIPKDYDELLSLFLKKEIDLAYFGGFTFIQAHEKVQAVPLVMRGIDMKFQSYILVNKKLNINKLEELKGHSFAFGSRLSTSGHLMPRYYLIDKNIDPEQLFPSLATVVHTTSRLTGLSKVKWMPEPSINLLLIGCLKTRDLIQLK